MGRKGPALEENQFRSRMRIVWTITLEDRKVIAFQGLELNPRADGTIVI